MALTIIVIIVGIAFFIMSDPTGRESISSTVLNEREVIKKIFPKSKNKIKQ